MESIRLRHTFLRETEELLEALDHGLLELESTEDAGDVVDRLFRAAHTLKGNAGMVGFTEAVRLTHVLENVLDRLRAGHLGNSPEVVNALFLSVDALRGITEQFRSNQPVVESPALVKAHEALLAHSSEAALEPIAVERVLQVTFYLRPQPWTGSEDLMTLLDEIAMVGEILEVETLFDRVPPLTSETANCAALGVRLRLQTTSSPMAVMGILFLSVEEEDLSIVDVTSIPKAYSLEAAAIAKWDTGGETATEGAVEGHPGEGQLPVIDAPNGVAADLARGAVEAAPTSLGVHSQKGATQRREVVKDRSTLRVDTEKLDRLMDLVGELVIGISQVRGTQTGGGSQAQLAVERLELLGRELQDQVMALRMLPIQDTFERFRRPIRDLSKELGKPVDFRIQGGETQVDKRVIDNLVDPLKHMLRNCVSHGIETPQERAARGKPAAGTIAVSAAQREGQVVIEISDDGGGIDPVRVRAKAEEKGLISKGQELSESQVLELIFYPGFSTATEVSEISGRGVGLDVVRRNIQTLRGVVEISSVIGRGTTFRIRLPLTLAIVDGMNVVVGDETVTIPLQSVVELIAVEAQTVRRIENEHEFIDVRGELLPMVRLGALLELPKTTAHAHEQRIVLVETERRKFGFLVDRVLGMSQTVIKSLDSGYQLIELADRSFDKPKSIGGAAILGDGNVGIIVDVHGIEQLAFEAA